jgi:hypothetical protein
MADIFISYERSDYARAEKIAEALGQHGWSVRWDRMLLAGDRFDKSIQKALGAARCVIVLWSKTSVSSDWVKDEAFEGAKRGILVPVLIDDVEIPFGFRQIHAARLTNCKASSSAPEFHEVLDAVSQLLGRLGAPETILVGADPALEMLGRKETATPGRPSVVDRPSEPKAKLQRRVFPVPGVFTLVAVTVIVCGLLGTLGYFLRQGTPQAQKESSPTRSSETPTEPKFTPGDAPAVGTAFGSLEFLWPGSDFWDIYQGEQLVATHNGTAYKAVCS